MNEPPRSGRATEEIGEYYGEDNPLGMEGKRVALRLSPFAQKTYFCTQNFVLAPAAGQRPHGTKLHILIGLKLEKLGVPRCVSSRFTGQKGVFCCGNEDLSVLMVGLEFGWTGGRKRR